MSRSLRIEFPGAVYHVTSRGDRREPIYRDDDDRRMHLDVLAQAMDSLPIPPITHCHTRLSLELQRSQENLRPPTMSPTERHRQDVWWLEPDGSNLDEAITDIRDSVLTYGIPFMLKPYNARDERLQRRSLPKCGDA
jgi:hypothetical protein